MQMYMFWCIEYQEHTHVKSREDEQWFDVGLADDRTGSILSILSCWIGSWNLFKLKLISQYLEK